MLRLYNDQDSGNSYKLRLLLTQLGIHFERIDIDLVGGETRSDRFRARNPLGQTPFVEFDDGRVLAESSAILWHLAEGTRFLPEDRWTRAQILQWMSFEQYRIEPNIGTPRFWITLKIADQRRVEVERKLEAGRVALQILDRHLATRAFVAAECCTIADLALYGYTHVGDEADYRLADYPAINAWFARMRAEPDHVPMKAYLGHAIPWPEARRS